MAIDTTYIGGKSFIELRAEGSKADLSKFGVYNDTGTSDKMLLATNYTNPRKNNMIRVYSLGGGRSYVAAVPGKYEISGTLEYEIQNLQHLKYALGGGPGTNLSGTSISTDLDGGAINGASGLKKYRLTEDDTLDSFSIDQYEISTATTNDIRLRYLGCKVNQLTIKSDTENPLHATIDWIGQRDLIVTEGEITPPSFSSYTELPKMFYTGTLLINPTLEMDSDGPTGKVSGGDTVVQANSIDMTLTNNLEPYWSINNSSGRGIKFAIEKQREYTLKLDLNFTNSDQLKRFYSGLKTASNPIDTEQYSPFAVIVDYKTPNTYGSDFNQLRFVYRDVFFDETNIPLNPKEIVKQELTAYAKHLDVFSITSESA